MTPEQYEARIKELEEALEDAEKRWQSVREDILSSVEKAENYLYDIKRIL